MKVFLGYYIVFFSLCVLHVSCNTHIDWNKNADIVLHEEIKQNAAWALEQTPQTITDFRCERSAGGVHDFYSEGDYWWPDPSNPDGPYIRKDGETNPENFIAHRQVMIRFSKIIGSLASAYVTTGDDKYVQAAFKHLNAWFVDTNTMMVPNLLYAQAI